MTPRPGPDRPAVPLRASHEATPAPLADVALWTVATGAAAATAASLLGRLDWRLALASHFRLHLAAGSLAGLVASVALRRDGAAAVLAAALAANLAEVAAREAGRPAAGSPADRRRGTAAVTLVSYNALRRNPRKRRALDWIARSGADLAVVVEVTPDWREALLDRLGPLYPYRAFGPDNNGAGVAVLSRHPLRRLAALDIDDQGLVAVRVLHPDLPFTLFAVHPAHAIRRRSLRPQRAFLGRLAALVRRVGGPVAVAGDLNTTPWSREFRRLLAQSGLDGPLLRAGTFPARLGRFGLPIDHVLTGGGLRLAAVEPGPDLGSDHRPVAARLVGA